MSDHTKRLVLLGAVFTLLYFLPMDAPLIRQAILSGFVLLGEYARKHVLTCLVPAFFIAGAIAVFVRKDVVLRYLGAQAKKYVSYSLAAVSGSILAVCSCTILPLFAGIRKRGAGLGPAITFLFSGPAINIAAMFLTISVLGIRIGLARITMAVSLSVLVGLSMQFIFREKVEDGELFVGESKHREIARPVLALFIGSMVGVLVVNGLQMPPALKYALIGLLVALTAGLALWRIDRQTVNDWLVETRDFANLLMPLLLGGVFVAGVIMVFLPESLVVGLAGSNSVSANLIAAIFGAFMYFSTLTEIPILQALIAKGMFKGPALALLLAGPSLSLPNMLVIRRVLGNTKTVVYVSLVIVYATIGGLAFGALF